MIIDGTMLERPADRTTLSGPLQSGRSYLPPAAAALLALEAKACRWPIGLPASEAFRFCGSAIKGHGSYCPNHTALSRGEGRR